MTNQIHVNGLQQGANSLTILEGKALDPVAPKKIELSGNIASVSNFLKKRYADGSQGKALQAVDRERAVVVVDDAAMNMVLFLDPENVYGTTVKGTLELTPELKQFHINTSTQFKREELVRLIKFSKRFFDSAEAFQVVYEAYIKLNLSTTGELKAESDSRGNKDLAFKKSVKSQGLPETFILNMPIFKGQKTERFRVEICLDATDASVSFWFDSTELDDLINTRKKEIFDAQLSSCHDFVIIYK